MICVLIGRSGSGKSAIAEMLKKNHGYTSVRTATTRERRDGEPEDAFYFMAKDEFMQKKEDEFVEWDVYGNHCYGTPRSELQKDGKLVIVITPEGAEAIKKAFPDAFVVLIKADMKTSAIRAIKRERILTPGKMYSIADRAGVDELIYKNPSCDYICTNGTGKVLEDAARQIAAAHENYEKNHPVPNVL